MPSLCLSVLCATVLCQVAFDITDTFGHTLRIMACTGTATGYVSMYMKKFKKKKNCPIPYSEALPMHACLALPLNHTITCDTVIPR